MAPRQQAGVSSPDPNPLSPTCGSGNVSSVRVGGTGSIISGGGGPLLLHVSGTQEGVAEASRRLDVTIRTTETVLTASPPLAAALRVSKRALLLRIEGEFRVKMFVMTAIVVVSASCGGSGTADRTTTEGKDRSGGSRGGGGGGGPPEYQPRGRRSAGALSATSGRATEVIIRGVPENVELARAYVAELDCLELVVPVERKSLSAIFGVGGANIQQMEVREYMA